MDHAGAHKNFESDSPEEGNGDDNSDDDDDMIEEVRVGTTEGVYDEEIVDNDGAQVDEEEVDIGMDIDT
ncbi:hypothetical protein EST38_g2592 [Candolleomyces aberdarensis]|uniref:Uncharacterized protein n=1 Tax=Candolleomyces aberdarensis TaxID=2316362 RepID=A0A4Q2DU98_9AGAR|nr:hypothetical protein EST38_g2592 [Candolleomyces aberdarensis]